MSRKTDAQPTAPEFLTDLEAAALLNLGMTRFLGIQKDDPSFPPPIWLGPRGKRHVRAELLAYALSKRDREAA